MLAVVVAEGPLERKSALPGRREDLEIEALGEDGPDPAASALPLVYVPALLVGQKLGVHEARGGMDRKVQDLPADVPVAAPAVAGPGAQARRRSAQLLGAQGGRDRRARRSRWGRPARPGGSARGSRGGRAPGRAETTRAYVSVVLRRKARPSSTIRRTRGSSYGHPGGGPRRSADREIIRLHPRAQHPARARPPLRARARAHNQHVPIRAQEHSYTCRRTLLSAWSTGVIHWCGIPLTSMPSSPFRSCWATRYYGDQVRCGLL